MSKTYETPPSGMRVRYQIYGRSSEAMGRVVVAYLYQEPKLYLGVSFCSPSDWYIFDEAEGRRRARQKLLNAPFIIEKNYPIDKVDLVLNATKKLLYAAPTVPANGKEFLVPAGAILQQSLLCVQVPNWVKMHLPRWGRNFAGYLARLEK